MYRFIAPLMLGSVRVCMCRGLVENVAEKGAWRLDLGETMVEKGAWWSGLGKAVTFAACARACWLDMEKRERA